jgi:hypothetical protein
MAAALLGFAGAIFGAVTALLGSAVSDRRQVRNEERRWRRDQLGSAYEQALRYLFRAANRRSELMNGRGAAVLRQKHQREWFDDLVEAQTWLRTATRYCAPIQLDRLRQVADLLDRYINRMVIADRSFDEKGFSIWRVLQVCIATVSECARMADGGESTSPSGDWHVMDAETGLVRGMSAEDYITEDDAPNAPMAP